MFVGFARFDFAEEIPLMPFRVLRPIPAMAVERIFEFFDNLRSRFLGTCKMVTCIVHFDVDNLRAFAEFLWVFVSRSRVPHHDAIANVRRKPYGTGNIFIEKVWGNHGAPGAYARNWSENTLRALYSRYNY